MGRNLWLALALACGLLLATGCAGVGAGGPTSNPNAGVPRQVNTNVLSQFIRVGEQLKVEFIDKTPPATFEQVVRDDGTITLELGQTFEAAGKSEAQLQEEIRARYVPKYYLRLTVNIIRNNRWYFVGGEVKNESQRPYTGDITVLKAIASAGGFTVYADKKRIELIRSNGEKLVVNADRIRDKKDPDPAVYPGDQIIVPLSKF